MTALPARVGRLEPNRSLDPMPSAKWLREEAARRCAARGMLPSHGEAFSKAVVAARGPYRSKWEREYAARLDAMQRAGLIRAWQYEARRFVVGVRRTYRPDFRVVHLARRIEYVEVKGSVRAKNARDSLTRLSVVALQYPHLSFTLATKRAGAWHETPLAA